MATDTKVITAHIPLGLAEKVETMAARLERSRGWVMRQALGKIPTGGVRGGVHALKKDAEQRGLYRPVEDYEPAPGDVFIMDMGRGTGHTGFVIGCSGELIETIEGNSGDRVRAGLRRLDDPKLIGFICAVPKERYPLCWMPGIGTDASGDGTR